VGASSRHRLYSCGEPLDNPELQALQEPGRRRYHGGLNMYLGNYEHTPLNRAWAAIDLTGDKTWFYGHEKELAGMNEAQKQEWAMKSQGVHPRPCGAHH